MGLASIINPRKIRIQIDGDEASLPIKETETESHALIIFLL